MFYRQYTFEFMGTRNEGIVLNSNTLENFQKFIVHYFNNIVDVYDFNIAYHH